MKPRCPGDDHTDVIHSVVLVKQTPQSHLRATGYVYVGSTLGRQLGRFTVTRRVSLYVQTRWWDSTKGGSRTGFWKHRRSSAGSKRSRHDTTRSELLRLILFLVANCYCRSLFLCVLFLAAVFCSTSCCLWSEPLP